MQMHPGAFNASKARIMQSLWRLAEKAEQAGMKDQARMLEVAGNIVENSFCSGNIEELIWDALDCEFECFKESH